MLLYKTNEDINLQYCLQTPSSLPLHTRRHPNTNALNPLYVYNYQNNMQRANHLMRLKSTVDVWILNLELVH